MIRVNSWYGPGGALVTNQPVPGVTERPLSDDNARYYGGQYMIGESMSESAARMISQTLGLVFMGRAMTAAHCIGCGCDDWNACADEQTCAPCHWLRVDRSEGLGVCSACPELVEAWDRGDREFRVPMGDEPR